MIGAALVSQKQHMMRMSEKLITTITLTEEQLATIKDANEKSTADNTLYKLAVNVQIKLSDGSTIYSVIDQKYSFNIAE